MIHRFQGRPRWQQRLVLIALLLLALRIALPFILLAVANDRLARIPGYHGSIQDLGLSLYRGAYRAEGLQLDKVDTISGERTPFLKAGVMDMSIHWRALLHGSLVGEIETRDAELRFTRDKVEPAQVQEDSATFRQLMDEAMPLRIDRFVINNGRVVYVDDGSAPPVRVTLDQLNVEARNLTNAVGQGDELPATVAADAMIHGGKLAMRMGLDPMRDAPHMEMDLALTGLQLTGINDLFEAYAGFDVSAGTFSVHMELATTSDRLRGYVKPYVEGLAVLDASYSNKSMWRTIWEHVVAATGWFLRDRGSGSVATKVPFDGRLDEPRVGGWAALARTVGHAFFEALEPQLDHEIDLESLRSKDHG